MIILPPNYTSEHQKRRQDLFAQLNQLRIEMLEKIRPIQEELEQIENHYPPCVMLTDNDMPSQIAGRFDRMKGKGRGELVATPKRSDRLKGTNNDV